MCLVIVYGREGLQLPHPTQLGFAQQTRIFVGASRTRTRARTRRTMGRSVRVVRAGPVDPRFLAHPSGCRRWGGVDRGWSLRSTPGYPLGPLAGSGLPGSNVPGTNVPGSDVPRSGGWVLVLGWMEIHTTTGAWSLFNVQ
jgi:hypothetical protein